MKTKKQWKKKFFGITLASLTVMSTLSVGLTSCSNGGGINIENIINPYADDAAGKFLTYGTIEASNQEQVETATPKNIDISYQKVVHGLLKDYQFTNAMMQNTVNNIIVNWFAGIKKSKNYYEEWQNMNKDIKKSWEDLESSTKKQYGDSWEYHMQSDVLDPCGGTKENWYFVQLVSKVMSSFENLLTSNLKIGVEGYNDALTHDDLFSTTGLVWNGWTNGKRNNISFNSGLTSSQDFSNAVSDFWEFVFDQFVKEKMPLVTSMVLFKHESTSNLGDFFDLGKIKQYDGYQSNDVVGTAGSYKWQAYPNKSVVSSTGAWNTTDKYNHFVADYGANGAKAQNPDLGGAINIDVKYTDDSATLYRINLNDVFTSSFTPYAAGATYKFNEMLGVTPDTNIATATELNSALLNGQQGTEIMNNFLSPSKKTGYFELNPVITNVLDKNDTSTPGFIGKYSGTKAIADVVDISNTPFILTRNEAGVHIIGIDRYTALKEAAGKSYQELINEIKNTLLWRSLVGLNEDDKAQTGFTLDIASELPTYFQSKKQELIIKYIEAKAEQKGSADGSVPGKPQAWESKGHEDYDANRDLFSPVYSSTIWTDGVPKFDDNGELVLAQDIEEQKNNVLLDPKLQKYYDAYFRRLNYDTFEQTPKDITNKLMTVEDSYEGKWASYSVIENGIAGQLMFTPTWPKTPTTPGDIDLNAPDRTVYFKSLLELIPMGGMDQRLDPNNTFKESEFKKLTDKYNEAAEELYTYWNGGTAFDPASTDLKGNFSLKNVDYPKYEENIFLQTPVETDKITPIKKETKTYTDSMTIISNKVNQEFSNGFKDAAQIDKILATIDDRVYTYDEGAPNSLLKQPAASTAPDSMTGSKNADVVNYWIENAITQTNRVTNFTTGSNSQLYGKWIGADGTADLDTLIKLAQNDKAQEIQNKYSSDSLETFKKILGYQYAFDFDTTSGEYLFTQFRDYLLSSTDNFQKAAFVWQVSDYDGAFTDATAYGKTLAEDFSFKNPIRNNNLINGYAYVGAPKLTVVNKDGSTPSPATGIGYFDGSKVTFNQDASAYNRVALKTGSTNQPNTVGFKGIQFQSSNNLDPAISSTIFNSNMNVPGSTAGTWKEQGTLFNLCTDASKPETGRAELKNRIDALNNWDQIRRAIQWFHTEFGFDTKEAYDKLADPSVTISDMIKILDGYVDNDVKLPNDVFTRIQGLQVANSSIVKSQPQNAKFFGDDVTNKSQIIISQFNHDDVVKLFDTDHDGKITDTDKGIDTTYGDTNGYLGQSFQAFMQAAYSWASNNQTFTSVAYNKMLKIQNNINLKEGDTNYDKLHPLVVNTYSRPLNDAFGKDWAANYKESVKVK